LTGQKGLLLFAECGDLPVKPVYADYLLILPRASELREVNEVHVFVIIKVARNLLVLRQPVVCYHGYVT
jgi:hypothetical protein